MSQTKYADKQIYRVHIEAPIETVWAELVKTTAPRPFLWDGAWDIPKFAAGQPYRVMANEDRNVAVIGRILEMDPPRKLVTTFRLTALSDPPSIVTYTLTEKDGGTVFSLITENIVAGSKSEKSMADGAKFIVENFKAYVETGKVKFGARLMLAGLSLMAPLAPKAMRTENWPRDRAE